ncbi:MAG: NEL-type E3 ubiquitin ligase domain-containing protein, partial [Burkholderiales bacterium]
MADTQLSHESSATVLANLAKIIIAMDQNSELREICFNLASESTQTCGDRVALGFIQMQLQVKLYKADASLSELFAQQKAMCTLGIIFKLAQNKVNSLTGIIDEVEVYLTYIKHLNDYLQVDIDDILHEALSNVTQDDIQTARVCLKDTLTDDYVYAALINFDPIKKLYASEFKAIQDQPGFDTSPDEEENGEAYKARMKSLDNKFKQAKVNLLKEQLRNFEQVLEPLPPLVEDN